VADNQNMLDLEYLHGIFQYGHTVKVSMHHQVGDVAVNKDLPRQQPDDFVGGYPAVGAADP